MPLRDGGIPEAVRSGFDAGLFSLPAQAGRPQASATASSQTLWHVPVVMVSFSDDTLDYGAAEFESALFDTTGATPDGSVYDYYRWASRGRLRVTGRVVAVVNLPHTREWYAALNYGLTYSGTPNNSFGAVYDALAQCHRTVNWAEFDQDRDGYVDMLWVLHAGEGGETSLDRNNLWSITSRLSGGWRGGSPFVTEQLLPGAINVYYRLDRFSILPELSGIRPGQRAEIGTFCHEFGHALGLPDLYDTTTLGGGANAGPGNWSLMATGGFGGNGVTPESPSHVGGWAARFLGWENSERPARDTVRTLAPLATSGGLLEFWFQGQPNPEHFLLEVRDRSGFDRSLNNGGLIVTHLDEAAIGQRLAANRINAGLTPGLWIVEADGDSDLVVGRNRGDAYDPFPGLGGRTEISEDSAPSTDSFAGAPTSIALSGIQRLGESVRFAMQVRAPGWNAPVVLEGPGYAPEASLGAAPAAVRDARGNVHVASSERRQGVPQIVVRSRDLAGAWEPPFVATASDVAALDPALALLPGGDLALAWSDARGGRGRIWYRARVRGVWSEPRLVGDLPGQNRGPTLAADDAGRVHLAWLNTQSDLPAVWTVSFLYFAPFGSPRPLTGTGELPGAPLAIADPSGTVHFAWIDNGLAPRRIMFRRFHPDSGYAARLAMTPPPGTDQTTFTLARGTDGALHTVWVSAGSASRELRWQRRSSALPPWPRDSVIEIRSAYLQELSMTVDPHGRLHVVYESAPTGQPQVWYKRWRPGYGWDLHSTEVAELADGGGSRPWLLAESPGNVAVLYTNYAGTVPALVMRERRLDPAQVVDVPQAAATPVAPRLEAGPNPVAPGQGLAFRWPAGAPGDAVELFDVAGRRVATARLERDLGPWRGATLDAGTVAGLRGGVYFARVRGGGGLARLVVLR